MKTLLTLLCTFTVITLSAQKHISLDTIKAPAATENIYSRPLAHDSLVSSFIIHIKKEVRKHKHETHAEHVYILEGEGEMLLGEKTIRVRKGDLVFIPKGMPHAVKVTSRKPMKVLSVQAPYFDGKDRVMME